MAYSWLSHCKRYLELLEGEKRFLKNYKARARRRAPPLASRSLSARGGGAQGGRACVAAAESARPCL
jgi:hypothetical protein